MLSSWLPQTNPQDPEPWKRRLVHHPLQRLRRYAAQTRAGASFAMTCKTALARSNRCPGNMCSCQRSSLRLKCVMAARRVGPYKSSAARFCHPSLSSGNSGARSRPCAEASKCRTARNRLRIKSLSLQRCHHISRANVLSKPSHKRADKTRARSCIWSSPPD